MAVYYKFKSAKDYDSVPIEGHFISVSNLKEKIFESKHLGRGTDFDLVISNAQTNEEYLDDAMLVPKNTSVLVRRVPGRPRMPIVTEREREKDESKETDISKEVLPPKNGFQFSESAQLKFPDDSEWDEFGTDLYATPEVPQVLQTQLPPVLQNKADEDSKIKAFVDLSASQWQRQTQESYNAGRGFGRGAGGRGMTGRGFGRGTERKTPPHGYVCHRCKVPGHFIQHCPTNGDPAYDIKKVKPPTGIPKSMLVATPDGSYALPSGAVAVLRPNEAVFEKEIEGFPSSRSLGELPPELHCPLCKEVMKDAVLTSKCCFKSYCDKCIRDHIISKSRCVCGATNILADDLLPNKTLRDTINRILETTTSSGENAGSWLQVQDMESARMPRPKPPSPTLSACAKEAHTTIPSQSDALNGKENISERKPPVNQSQQSSDKNQATKNVEPLEVVPESMSTKEPVSQESAPLAEEEVQQKLPVVEPGKKKKKRRAKQPSSNSEMQWRASQDCGAEGCLIPYSATAYNSYWPGTQWGADGYMASYGAGVPFIGYGPGPCDMTFGGAMMPQDPYATQGYMPSVVPPVQREYIDYGMGTYNSGLPVLSREEFEARKADLKRKREQERLSSREKTKDVIANEGETAFAKPKARILSQATVPSRDGKDVSNERHRDSEQSQLSPRAQVKRKADRDEYQTRDVRFSSATKSDCHASADAELNKMNKLGTSGRLDRKQKGSVFSRISFPGDRDIEDVQIPPLKKRRASSQDSLNGFKEHENMARVLNGNRAIYDDAKPVKRNANGRRFNYDDDVSDDERNFKRRASSLRREAGDERDDDKYPDGNVRTSKSIRDRAHPSK